MGLNFLTDMGRTDASLPWGGAIICLPAPMVEAKVRQ